MVDRWPIRNELNNILKNNNINGYIFERDWMYGYMNYNVIFITIAGIGFATFGIFIILLIFLNIRLSIFTLFIVLCIDI